jgi:hypothetical protein
MSVSKEVPFSIGLVTFNVDLHSSVEKDNRGTGLSNFCIGKPGAVRHEPLKTVAPLHCPDLGCGNEDRSSFEKFKKQGNGWVHVPDGVVIDAQDTVPTKGAGMRFTGHPTKDVDQHMIAIDAPYYLAYTGAAGSAGAEAYALIANWVGANGDVALLTNYAVRTAPAIYRLLVNDGVLMLQKVCFPSDMQAAPIVPTQFNPGYVPMLTEAIRSNLDEFDPANWADTRRALIEAYDSPDAPVTAAADAPLAPVFDLTAALAASIKAPAEAKSVRKRAPRKKAAA